MMINNTYTYWLYYWIDLSNDSQDYTLYAYTDTKELADLFELFRDMSKFKKKKKELTKDEIHYLASNETDKYMKMTTLEIYDKNKKVYGNMKTAITMNESVTLQNCINNINFGLICKYCWIDPNIFEDRIKKSLKILRYDKCYEYIYNDSKGYESKFIKADELGIFVRYFGKTLKSM